LQWRGPASFWPVCWRLGRHCGRCTVNDVSERPGMPRRPLQRNVRSARLVKGFTAAQPRPCWALLTRNPAEFVLEAEQQLPSRRRNNTRVATPHEAACGDSESEGRPSCGPGLSAQEAMKGTLGFGSHGGCRRERPRRGGEGSPFRQLRPSLRSCSELAVHSVEPTLFTVVNRTSQWQQVEPAAKEAPIPQKLDYESQETASGSFPAGAIS